ncbi:mucin TcMUCII, putative [Trypanosoma cruzi marinkellei]|uniref:Mucin TcMUCII, putative n=1 Tax=Trypanosoma cruzi marinkellei TaxID=85056 RepID=K2M2T3_TRYCR|nr:mucin TcMUCII, putative [Trypanosoma cruzi marinkellei]
MMTTCRLLCALLVLALCCCPSVCGAQSDAEVTDGRPTSLTPEPPVKGVSGQANIPATSSLIGQPATLPAPSEKADAQVIPVRGIVTVQTSGGNGTTLSTGTTVTVGSHDQRGGKPEKSRNSAEQPHGTPNLEKAPGSPKTVQEQAKITETSGSRSESESSKQHKETEEKQSEGSGPENVPSDNSDTTMGPTSTQQGPSGSGGSTSGSANPMAQIRTNGTVTVQSQKENVPNTTTTTTVPEAPSTTTTEAPTTTTTRAPSRLPEIDGSLSSSAWVCAPLLLAVSALAYTTLG